MCDLFLFNNFVNRYLFLGGNERCCYVEIYGKTSFHRMRKTGDLGKIINGKIFCLGRSDDARKRLGYLVHVDSVNEEIRTIPEVEDAFCVWEDSSANYSSEKLVAFVVLSDKYCASSSHSSLKNGSLEREDKLISHIRNSLQSSFQPDDIVLISSMPITTHGKVDRSLLLSDYRKKTIPLQSDFSCSDYVQKCWQQTLNRNIEFSADKDDPFSLHVDDNRCSMSDHFIECGGDSFLALQLMNSLNKYLERRNCTNPTNHLLQYILQNSLSELIAYTESCLSDEPNSSVNLMNCNVVKKLRDSENNNDSLLDKRIAGRETVKFEETLQCSHFTAHSSRGILYYCNCNKTSPAKSKHMVQRFENVRWSYTSNNFHPPSEVDSLHRSSSNSFGQELYDPTLTILWKSNMYRCVDASPLIVTSNDTDELNSVVYIGSHSCVFSAISLNDGSKLWETVLGDRIESSAAISDDGNFIIVGKF